mgnify:CR=1 FL=1
MPSLLKTIMVKEIDSRIGAARSLVLLGAERLKAKEETTLRSAAAKRKISMFRLRNNLAGLVFEQHGRSALRKHLSGSTVAVFCDDPVELAKYMKELTGTKELAERLELRGGWMLGKYMTPANVIAMADMPPYEQMIATFLATVSGPVNGLLSSISSPVSNLLNVLEQVRDSKQESQAS